MASVEIVKRDSGKCLVSKSDFPSSATVFIDTALVHIQSACWACYVPDLLLEILKTRKTEVKEFIEEFEHPINEDAMYNFDFIQRISEEENLPFEDVLQLYHICTVRSIRMNSREPSKPQGCGIYRYLSFINHSCDPNVKFQTIDPSRGIESIQSIKEIKQGDEITICYMDTSVLTLPVKDRQAIIYQQLRFVCQCSKCREEMAALEKE